MRYLQLNDIDCYKRALKLSNFVWDIVSSWNWFAQRTVGVQFVTAVDSISANIAEGFGRYGKKDKAKFYYYRKLLTPEQYNLILKELQNLPKEIHQLVQFTNDKLKV